MELSATAIIGLINLILIILVAIVNHLNHTKLVGNDLHHLSKDVKEIKDKQVGIEMNVTNLAVDLAFVKGNCSLNVCKKTTRKNKKISKLE